MSYPAQQSKKFFKIDTNQEKLLEDLLALLDFSKDINYFKRCLHSSDEERLVLGAEVDGQWVGVCILNFAPHYPAFRRLKIPEIQDLNVLPDYRRQGIGAGLITACEKIACERGLDTMGMGVGLTSTYGNAQRLYARLGYLPDGAGVYYDGVPVTHGEMRPIDDNLCLMMLKELK